MNPTTTQPHVPHDPYAALRYREYRLFSIGWVLSVMGNQMTAVALGWEIFDKTGSKAALGWLGGIQAIPLLLLTLPAGAIADFFDRRRIITVTSILAAGCSLGMAAMSYNHSPHYLWIMYGLLLAMSTVLVAGRPARAALLPTIVPSEVFANAITWNSSFFQVAAMVGPAAGGAVITLSLARYGNVKLAYVLDALCAISMAVIVCFLPKPRYASGPAASGQSRIANLLAGLKFVRRNRIILATLTLDLFAVLLGGAVYLLPVFAKDILNAGPAGVGWLRAAEAVGAICMAMLLAHLPPMRKAGRAMLLAVAGFGAATIVFGLSRSFWLSFAAMVLVGAMDNISVVVRHTLVQVLTPDSMRGRVSAVNGIFIGASNELGGLESGLTAHWFGPVASVVGGGIGTILVVLGIGWLWPDVRRFGSLADARPADEQEPRGFEIIPACPPAGPVTAGAAAHSANDPAEGPTQPAA